jgi:hypothetical protein
MSLLTIATSYMGILNSDAPETDLAGYPANPKARYRISGEAGFLANNSNVF